MSEWIERNLEDILLTMENGLRPKGGATEDTGEIPSLGGENIVQSGGVTLQNVKKIPVEFYNSLKRGQLQDRDVLINKDGANTGKVGFFNSPQILPAAINEHLFLIRGKSEVISQEYLYYCLLSEDYQAKIKDKISGSAQPGLNQTFTRNFKIKLPAAPAAQARIAKILSTVDAAIEQTEALIAKYSRIRTGLMQDLLTRGIDRQGRIRSEETHEFKDSPLGRIPVEWEVVEIGQICEMILGKMLNKDARKDKDQDEYLGNRSVKWDHFDFSNLEMMSFSPAEKEKLRLLRDDVLMCEGGEVGRCAIWRNEREGIYFQKAIHRLRFDQEKMQSHFFVNYFKMLISKGFLKDYVSQTSIAHLTQEKLAKIPIVCPEIGEQKRITRIMRKVRSDNVIETSRKEKLQTLKKGLMQDLLSGPPPNTEPTTE